MAMLGYGMQARQATRAEQVQSTLAHEQERSQTVLDIAHQRRQASILPATPFQVFSPRLSNRPCVAQGVQADGN